MLSNLIESHDECVSRLINEIHNDGDYKIINTLDSRIKLLAGAIRDLHLSSAEDINRQIKFFLNRTVSMGDDNLTSDDRNTIEELIDRYTQPREAQMPIGQEGPAVDAQAFVQLGDNRFVTDQLFESSNARFSLYNLNYEYEYTSLGNAQFHNTVPERFLGKHVAEIVGDRRFEDRAKRYYDRCFAGEHLKYSYFLNVEDRGERLMNCQLTPYRDSDGGVRGAFFKVEDVTELMEHATQSAISNAVN